MVITLNSEKNTPLQNYYYRLEGKAFTPQSDVKA